MNIEQIYQILPLNKDICKLIFNYINYTEETLNKLIQLNKHIDTENRSKAVKILESKSILDLILKSISLGCSGFWTLPFGYYFKVINERVINENFINVELSGLGNRYFYEIKNNKNDSYIYITELLTHFVNSEN
jgi:hypothetical protein